MKPIIGITANSLFRPSNSSGKFITFNNEEYEKAVILAGGVPILLSPTCETDVLEAQLKLCDGLILAGGDDINPLLYGEEPLPALGETHFAIDQSHLNLARLALSHQLPILGICRGMQLLNIAQGGSVYQDLAYAPHPLLKHQQNAPRFDLCHPVSAAPNSAISVLLGTSFPVNSFHHQAISTLGTDVALAAHASDGIVEAIELQNYPFAVGVQWHPEIMLIQSPAMLPLFKALIQKAIEGHKN